MLLATFNIAITVVVPFAVIGSATVGDRVGPREGAGVCGIFP